MTLYKEKLAEIPFIPNIRTKALNYVFENDLVSHDGMWLEFGTYDGRSVNKIALYTANKVYGFDSFEGLPEPWVGRRDPDGSFNWPAGQFDLGGANPEFTVNQFFRFENVEFIKGWFNDTLPVFMKQHSDEPIVFMHIDSDIYSSAVTVLESTLKNIKDGCIIVFDELLGYTGFEEHEWRAWWEFVDKYQIEFQWIGTSHHGENIDCLNPKYARRFGEGAPSYHLRVSPSYENAAVRITKNPHYALNKKIIRVDIDETICVTPNNPRRYDAAVPIPANIEKINKLYDQGHTIIYWTSRGSRSGLDWHSLTENQLKSWGAKFHNLECTKPYYDLFIDDKSINIEGLT